MSDAPTLRAFVVCAVAFQGKDNSWNLIGVTDTITVNVVPARVNQILMYVRIADVPLKGVLRLDIRDAGGNLAASAGQNSFAMKDRTMDLEVVMRVPNVTFAALGQYFAEVYIDNTLTGSWPLSVRAGAECP